MSFASPQSDLCLQPLSLAEGGAIVEPLALVPGRGFIIGRSAEADWCIAEPSVSRRHATIRAIDGTWYLCDIGSRHGTSVNGNALTRGDQAPLRAGDQVRFGQWACRMQDGRRSTISVSSQPEPAAGSGVISRLAQARMPDLAQSRLNALLDASRRLSNAPDFAHVAAALTAGVVAGTGCSRALMLRQIALDEYELVGIDLSAAGLTLSRSLLAAALAGTTVQLGNAASLQPAQSVIDLNIRTAICAPIMVGDVVDALLYVDTREGETRIDDDAAAFCQAIAQIGGLAAERLRRSENEAQRLRMESDLAAARRAQDLLMPARTGTAPGVRYAFESLAGRLVAGDLFDIVPLDEHRTAFFLGDVAGKGVGAAVLMAATQSSLRTMLIRGEGLRAAMVALNDYLFQRTASNLFVTMVAGIIDRSTSSVEIVDAGHGLCCVVESGHNPRVIEGGGGGLPLGVSGGEQYDHAVFELGAKGRVVLFSDGVVEQSNPTGSMFGLAAAMAIVAKSVTPDDDVRTLVLAVQQHADGPLADDLTVASIALED